MPALRGKIILVLAMATLALGCSRGEPKLLNIEASKQGPDEFAILPNKPLAEPESYNALPTPTPGGSNRVDATPNEDAIAVLGGNPNLVARSGAIPSNDAGLVGHASRYGRAGNIRQQLAAEDLEFRRRKNGRVLERAFNVNVYFRAYRNQSLDKYAELERFRRIGVRTPAAPPDVQPE